MSEADALDRDAQTSHSGGASRKAGRSTRLALLDALHQLLLDNHGAIPSIAEIAQAAKANSALIAYHFGSKDGLLFALIESILLPRKDSIADLIEQPLDPLEKLRIYIRGLVSLYSDYPYLTQLTVSLIAIETGDVAGRLSDELLKPVQVNQAILLREAADAGLIELADPRFFYFVVLGACERMFASRYALNDIFGIDHITPKLKQDYADYVQRAILSGIVKPEAR